MMQAVHVTEALTPDAMLNSAFLDVLFATIERAADGQLMFVPPFLFDKRPNVMDV